MRIHLNQKSRYSHLPYWNSQIEKEDRCPGEEKEAVKLPGFRNDGHMVSKAMENRKDPDDLGYYCKCLFGVSILTES